jgi:hypothetical protein
MWVLVIGVGFGTWVLAVLALIVGAVAAQRILVPELDAQDASRARQLARYRTLIGFGLLAALSMPYRSVDDTLDKVWGNFNMSVGVGLAAFVVLGGAFMLALRADSRARANSEWPLVWTRVGKFVLAVVVCWLALWLLEKVSWWSPEWARLNLIILFGFLGLFAMGCWCISCHWFGIGRVHPLLPPLVAAVTITAMTVLELHSGGPEGLPLRLWLLVNLSAVITTFGVCLVEMCDALDAAASAGGDPARWPVVAAVTVVGLGLTGAAVLVAAGTAERILCADDLVVCTNTAAAVPGAGRWGN